MATGTHASKAKRTDDRAPAKTAARGSRRVPLQCAAGQNRSLGNAATASLIQTKLKVGAAGDRHEKEADHVASQVMRDIQSGHVAQRQEKDEELRRKPLLQRQPGPVLGTAGGDLDSDTDAAIRQAKGGGRPLDTNVQRTMESSFGADFSGVRIHDDAGAHQANETLQARAFTTGSDIFFRKGEYSPSSRSGQKLLAHELTHVVQQGATNTTESGHIQRFFGFGKKTAKKDFAKAVKGKAPADADEAKSRMSTLRATLKAMTSEERATIASDRKLMAKARAFVGDHEYMSLVTAVGMAYKKKQKKKGAAAAPTGPQHLSGAEADLFIRTEMAKHAHIKPFIDTAVAGGKQAEGFVATVGDDDWAAIYEEQYAAWGDKVGDADELNTNAFIANQHADRPAIIHHERGTRSTAIHESMHRYSELVVLRSIGSGLNEGITEYFTRLITDKDANPTNGAASNRTNYQRNWRFVCDLVSMLGDDVVAGQTLLAKIYFSGELGQLKTRFDASCAAAQLSAEDTAARWTEFEAALKSSDWDAARAKFPPPPAPPTPVAPPTPEATTPTAPATPPATPPETTPLAPAVSA